MGHRTYRDDALFRVFRAPCPTLLGGWPCGGIRHASRRLFKQHYPVTHVSLPHSCLSKHNPNINIQEEASYPTRSSTFIPLLDACHPTKLCYLEICKVRNRVMQTCMHACMRADILTHQHTYLYACMHGMRKRTWARAHTHTHTQTPCMFLVIASMCACT